MVLECFDKRVIVSRVDDLVKQATLTWFDDPEARVTVMLLEDPGKTLIVT